MIGWPTGREIWRCELHQEVPLFGQLVGRMAQLSDPDMQRVLGDPELGLKFIAAHQPCHRRIAAAWPDRRRTSAERLATSAIGGDSNHAFNEMNFLSSGSAKAATENRSGISD